MSAARSDTVARPLAFVVAGEGFLRDVARALVSCDEQRDLDLGLHGYHLLSVWDVCCAAWARCLPAVREVMTMIGSAALRGSPRTLRVSSKPSMRSPSHA